MRCPYGPRRAPCGNLQCFSYPAGPIRARAWPARVPYDALTDTQGNWRNQNWQESRTGAVFCRTGPTRAPYGLYMGCLKSINPYGARSLIMHALKLYGPHTGRQIPTAPHGTCAGPVSGRTIFVHNSLWTAREQPVRSPGVWCDWGIRNTWHRGLCRTSGAYWVPAQQYQYGTIWFI